MVRIFILAILAFALCSCAELFRANPNALPMITIISVAFLGKEIRSRALISMWALKAIQTALSFISFVPFRGRVRH